MTEFNIVQTLAIWALPVLFAVTLHEVAHGWVARYFGDDTAAQQGRLSLNPIRHVDPVGTVLVPAAAVFLTGFIFGWAKPVPVNFARLRRPKRDMIFVALAGPGANILMAIMWAIALRTGVELTAGESLTVPVVAMCIAGIFVNLVLAVFNLIPIPPLDGSRVVVTMLKPTAARNYMRLEPYGILIVLALLFVGVLWPLIGIPVVVMLQALSNLVGIDPSSVFSVLNFLLNKGK